MANALAATPGATNLSSMHYRYHPYRHPFPLSASVQQHQKVFPNLYPLLQPSAQTKTAHNQQQHSPVSCTQLNIQQTAPNSNGITSSIAGKNMAENESNYRQYVGPLLEQHQQAFCNSQQQQTLSFLPNIVGSNPSISQQQQHSSTIPKTMVAMMQAQQQQMVKFLHLNC